MQKQVRHLHSEYVFVDKEGKRFKEIKRLFKSALRRSGIKDFTFHDLKHTFASHLVMAGIGLTTIKELLGHKTIRNDFEVCPFSPKP